VSLFLSLGLQQPLLPEAYKLTPATFIAVADNHMIQNFDPYDFPGGHQVSGASDILFGRYGIAARVVMNQQHAGTGLANGRPEYFTGMNLAPVHEADSHTMIPDQGVFRVEQQRMEFLLPFPAERLPHEVGHLRRRGQPEQPVPRLSAETPGQRERGMQFHRFRNTDTVKLLKLRHGGLCDAAQSAAELVENTPRQSDHRTPCASGAQKNRQKLGVAQSFRTELQQSLPGTLALGHLGNAELGHSFKIIGFHISIAS
jgi:hypothetical protein